ncbi:MAG: Phosphoheptose isomerase-like protein, partial [Solirubrobacterales bacterium]|nr:Phosphoheptose isomerase-like protein [Solirubrobacterales bacterium]
MTATLALAAGERRRAAGEEFFEREADSIARACHRMAERFARDGRLIAFGEGPVARSDARHVAVEFVHPVIVGKRALPALALTDEGGPVDEQAHLALEPADIALAFGDGARTQRALSVARERGCLTIATERIGAEWELVPEGSGAERGDAFVAQELGETLYHVLWELVHVFLEHRGLLAGRSERIVHDTGASSFLYPFLAEQEH